MRLSDALSLSTRMFRTRPLRTLLTVMGVGVGIGTVLFLVSLGYGLQDAVLSRITTADALLSLDVAPGSSELITLNKDVIDKIKKIPNVEEVSPVISASAQISLENLVGDGTMYAVKPSYFRLSGVDTILGDLFENNTDENPKAIVSSAAVQLFNMNPEDILGKEFNLSFFIPRIDGEGVEHLEIVDKDTMYSIVGVVADDSESFVYIPLASVESVGIENFLETKVKVSSIEAMDNIRLEIVEMGFFVSALKDVIEDAQKIFSIVQLILGLFGLVALTVSAIGMFNTMTVMLLERTNEIGIMRSIGVTRRSIRTLFIVEAMLMGFLGGLGGVGIGILGGEIFNFIINILAKNLGGESVDLFVSPFWFIGVIIFFSTVIGFMTGVFPARRAAKLNPLDALRYK
ncbi:MAG: ABC transporter permease [Candidatus Magasanikbacteria bacterium]|nr:ABC transporter permease [Candidatus Magasanikbacteria bacterium]